MILTRRLLCIILLFVAMGSQAWANNTPSAEKRAQVITKWMKQRLELSSKQLSLVASLNLKFEKEIDVVTERNEGFSCMKEVRNTLKKKEKELRSLFSVHQFEVYRKGKCELKEELKRCSRAN